MLLRGYYTDMDECLEGIHDCNPHAYCTNDDGGYNCTCVNGYSGNGFTCGEDMNEMSYSIKNLHSLSECSDGDVRLVGGNNTLEGRVELCQNNAYRTVCDDFWDELEAKVVCRQMGYLGEGKCNVFPLCCYSIFVHNSCETKI